MWLSKIDLTGVGFFMIRFSIRSTFLPVFLAVSLMVGCSSPPIPEAKPVVIAKSEVKPIQAPPVVRTPPQKKIVAKPVQISPPKVVAKKRVQQVRKPVVRMQAAPKVQRKAWRENGNYALTGDFASNPHAQQFIQRMSREYGMDQSYLNKLFSNARDTGLYVKPLRKRTKKGSRKGSWTRYRSFFLTSRHINEGAQFWRKYRHQLEQAERQYGVPAEYIVGILGVETIYGGNVGKHRAIDALSTKAFIPSRRSKFFTNELEKFLLMARSEGLNPYQVMGSTAGALGLGQFMPSNFKPLSVDFNRNGVRNLWDPVDAIGSVANYFKKHGWRTGGKVVVPATAMSSKYKSLSWGYKHKHRLSRLQNLGITAGGDIDQPVRLVRLSTNHGEEVWLGGHNFYVITRYNHSSKYAMAVHQLAQAVKQRYMGGSSVAQK
ncbi:MAG: Membrane-bound lytic murein transglycosylase B precursor (EC [uncultured Thiotrichaceae bacterium]|uniref:Membrane-bound lytic murein transglycosylase B (EC) n=1 Tax=uncultured Thiotrichaceae bacterium TaxID=298394 RepID=A0A6S6SCC4_9GAMM|nr:MAG: Membrane-bound lytic murein transglycosylase B precursor (EC [uncultured Thiotrichaceae bacterium]